jgi:hypothetical protein
VEPGSGTTYVITGGGGADLHDVNCSATTEVALEIYNYLRVDIDGETLALTATGVDGAVIEQFLL